MGAARRTARGTRLPAALVAVVLVCVLGGTAGVLARSHVTNHPHRGLVAAAAPIADPPSGPQRGDHTADVVAAPGTRLVRGPAGTADSSAVAPALTARTPQVRGPPSKAGA